MTHTRARSRAVHGGDGEKRGRPGRKLSQVLFDLVDQAVVVCDPSGVVRWCNRLTGVYFPGLRPGKVPDLAVAGPLGQAVVSSAARFDAEFLGRRLAGRRSTVGDCPVWLIRDETEVRRCEVELRAERSRTAFLSEAGRRLGASLHHGRTARGVVELAVPALADAALLVLPPRAGHADWYRCAAPGAAESGALPASSLERVPPLRRALSGLWPWPAVCPPGQFAALRGAPPDPGKGGGESLVTALPGSEAPAGALVLFRSAEAGGWNAEDAAVVGDFAFRAGMALSTAALYAQQAHTADVLQAGLDPAPLPDVPGVRLGAAYRPAPGELGFGGDFYQVEPARDDGGGVEFVLGDVCGKGVEAAVLTGHVRQSLRTLALVESRPLRVLDVLNQSLLEADSGRFASLVIGTARPGSGGALDVVLAGGGHPPPLVLRRGGAVEAVDVGGMLVGALPGPEFGQAGVHLAPEELILLYSDGVTEARGGPEGAEEYGAERLAHDLEVCAGMPAGAVAERVDMRVAHWLAGRAHDDIAVLVLQASPGSSGTAGAPR
ncbi:serine/threonine-protein phosphatase [Streptomyces cynarae]|uniref:Serine/threonine-protein phosphatase n=1 Tax=Streptomyces cynarae TaxID=2981134 RepID=A0ABY6EB30_9ACTN|nr:PP2C family protein-serine/threonine phosphatase [Streptomyces cynarae]UXY23006.1 serine/threonine-protein phosphatase [Streptomyces cynarae]